MPAHLCKGLPLRLKHLLGDPGVLAAPTGRGGGRLDICASAEIGAECAFGVIAVTQSPWQRSRDTLWASV